MCGQHPLGTAGRCPHVHCVRVCLCVCCICILQLVFQSAAVCDVRVVTLTCRCVGFLQVLLNKAPVDVRIQMQLGGRDSGLLLRQLWYTIMLLPTQSQRDFRSACCRLLSALVEGNAGYGVALVANFGHIWHLCSLNVRVQAPRPCFVLCYVVSCRSYRLAHILRRAFPPGLHSSVDVVVQFDEYGRVAGYQRPARSNFGTRCLTSVSCSASRLVVLVCVCVRVCLIDVGVAIVWVLTLRCVAWLGRGCHPTGQFQDQAVSVLSRSRATGVQSQQRHGVRRLSTGPRV